MSNPVVPGPVCDATGVREAVCIHTKKIFDSCRDRDCIEELRFYPTQSSQNVIDRALSIRSGTAELLNVCVDVEPTGFNRGFYSVDIRYFYRITAEAFVGAARPVEITGLAIFDKRVLLFGGEGNAKVFSSENSCLELDERSGRQASAPTAVVEVVDPLVLNMKLVDPNDSCNPCCPPPPCPPPPCPPPCGGCDCFSVDSDNFDIPAYISSFFGTDLYFGTDRKRVYVTLGQFSIIRLERDTQLLIPVYDYCLPCKECTGSDSCVEDDPCELFRQIQFPVDDFFPPNAPTNDNNCCCN